jgi:hypothetical protein
MGVKMEQKVKLYVNFKLPIQLLKLVTHMNFNTQWDNWFNHHYEVLSEGRATKNELTMSEQKRGFVGNYVECVWEWV